MTIKIGLTGGIGSGKSTIAAIFKVLGIPVYYADDAAKKLMNSDPFLIGELTAAFGKDTYTNGQLNRSYLSSLVFNNPQKLAKLNSIVHPATIADADKWMLQQTSVYAIKEAALIFESGANKHLDKTIGVFCPVQLRVTRVMQRDGTTQEAVTARIGKQMDEEKKMALCDYVITNDDTQLVIPQVLAIHQKLIRLKA